MIYEVRTYDIKPRSLAEVDRSALQLGAAKFLPQL